MRRAASTVGLFLAWALVVPACLHAQETAERTAGEESASADRQVSVERESFTYPASGRRDPFAPLSAGDGLGPRFEDLHLSGILYSPSSGSVAILTDQATGKRYRVWEGDVIGGARLARVRPTEADFVVTAFGVSRQETLRVKSQDKEQGG